MGSNDQEYTILYILYILLSHPFKSLTNCSCALCTRFKSNKTTTGIYLLQQHPKIASCWQCFGQDSWILQREETNYNPKGQGLRTTKNIVWPWHPKSFHLWSSICSLSGESPLTLHYPEPSAPIHPTLNVRTRPKEAWENFASACKLCLGKQPRVWWCLVPAPKALVIDDWRPKTHQVGPSCNSREVWGDGKTSRNDLPANCINWDDAACTKRPSMSTSK